MGHVSHHAIIVTGCIDGLVAQAHEAACLAGLMPTEVTHAQVNGYESFMVPPVGSKEGWPPAVEAESQRARFKAELRRPPFVYDDGSPGVSWVEVHFDCRTPGAVITDGDDENRGADPLHWDQRDLDDAAAILKADQDRLAQQEPTNET